MTITINLTSTPGSTKGVNFNKDFKSFFSGFTASGWPYILGGSSQFKGDQIVLLDTIRKGAERDTKAIILDGSNVNYYFNSHVLSGTLKTVRLSKLGDSYNADGSFTIQNGHIAKVTTSIEITGLKISNPYQVKGDFHNVTSALMGGGHNGGKANPVPLEKFLWAEGHRVNGSAGGDTYVGTKFADIVYGNGGNDALSGGAGNDTLRGGAGNDTLRGGAGNDKLYGDAGNDTLVGDAGNDSMWGGAGNDTLSGGAGNDKLYGEAGNDTLRGGAGNDTLSGGAGNDRLFGDAGNDTIRGGVGNDVAYGGAGNDTAYGDAGNDTLWGGAGNDKLYGGAGNDRLIGGLGADLLHGGPGADTFVFSSLKDSTVAASGRDTIAGFSGKAGDRIDLRPIDADTTASGNQAFDFIGTGKFTGTAGELRYEKTSAGTFVHGDVNGDGRADFSIRLDKAVTLTEGYFLL